MNAYMLRHQDSGNSIIEKVYSTHYGKMLVYANRLIYNLKEAEDIVADAFANAVLNKSLNTESSLKNYIFISIRNSCYTYFKKQKRIADPAELETLVSDDGTPISTFYYLLLAECFHFAKQEIENLPGLCREVMRLHLLENMRLSDIAKKLSKEQNHIRQEKRKGINLLSQKIRQHPKFSQLHNTVIIILLISLWTIFKKIFSIPD